MCPAGTPAGLRTAVDAGADAVYCGFQGPTNARNFPGLNFTVAEMADAVSYAHERGAKVLAAINSFATAGRTGIWRKAIDDAVGIGVDAVIVADIGMAGYRKEPSGSARSTCRFRPAPLHRRRSTFTAARSASSAWCCRAF